MEDIQERVAIDGAIARGISEDDLALAPAPGPPGPLARHLLIPFSDGLAPTPIPITPAPDPAAPLPAADVVVITWTVDEQDALCDVFTPGFGRSAWYRYTRNFPDYAPASERERRPPPRSGWGATSRPRSAPPPSCASSRSSISTRTASEPRRGDGHAAGEGPVPPDHRGGAAHRRAHDRHVGGVFAVHQLGDVVVTRGAKFRLASEFRNEPFNGAVFTSDWEIPTARFDEAESLMAAFAGELAEPPLLPPTKAYHYHGSMIHTDPNVPDIKLDGRDMPAFHPILTTDYFEFGTSANRLDLEGAAVEMGDAALGLAAASLRIRLAGLPCGTCQIRRSTATSPSTATD